MANFDVHVTRDGPWWMIAIPEIDGLTQAASFREIDEMARSYIAVSTGTPVEMITLRIVDLTP